MLRRAVMMAAGSAMLPRVADAQGWPRRTIRLMISLPDEPVAARLAEIVASCLSDGLSTVVQVAPMDRGSGVDDHALVLTSNIASAVPPADLTPVGLVGVTPQLLVVSPDLVTKSLAGFVATAGGAPSKLTFVSNGVASLSHLTMSLFTLQLGLNLRHVPMRGPSQMLEELVADRADVAFLPASSMLQDAGARRLAVLASTAQRQGPPLESVPTIAGALLPGFLAEVWFALFAPQGLADDVIERINAALNEALGQQDRRRELQQLGLAARPMRLPALLQFFEREQKRWTKLANDSILPRD